MKYLQLTLLFSGVFLLSFRLQAQQNEIYLTTYDSIVGKENLKITNGLFHFNNYRINKNLDIYYSSDKYLNGSIIYLEQPYYNLSLKYDAYNDELIYRSAGKSEKTGIILIKNNVESFQINGFNFVNLDRFTSKENDFIKGYYEEKIKNETLSFYIKHYKSKREVFINKNVFTEFSDEMDFIIQIDNSFKKVSSKNSVISLFPDKKKIINDYFKNNSELKKRDTSTFFTNLFQSLSQ